MVRNNQIHYFIIFENFVFSDHQAGEGKRAETDPKVHQPVHAINSGTVHHVIIIFGTIAFKIMICTGFSIFFVNLVFLICQRGKREENIPKRPINLSTLQLHSLHFVIIFGALALV